MLRQQLIVLNRQVKRPKLTNRDRLRLVLLVRCTQFWQQALHIVQPDTPIRWHRELFQLYWRYKSRKERTAHSKQYIPFARKPSELAKGFEERQILALVIQ